MNSRDRVLAAFNLEEPDIVPWFDGVDLRVLRSIFPEIDIPKEKLPQGTAEPLIIAKRWRNMAKAFRKLGIDSFLCAPIWDPSYIVKLDETHYVDEWGRILSTTKQGDISDAYIGGYFDTPEKYAEHRLAPPVSEWRLAYFRAVRDFVSDDFFLIPAVGSVFELAMEGIGVHNLPRILYTNPNYFDRFLRDNANYCLELGRALVDEGAEALIVFDDYAYHSGPFISPKQWMKHVYPPTKRLLDGLHKKAVPIMLHACGDLHLLMEGIIDAEYDAINPLEATANMNLKEAKERWGDRICLVGNTDLNTLAFGQPEDVVAEVRSGIEAAAPGGGYILASSHAIYHSCKARNVLAMRETRKKYGRYKK